MLAYGVMRMLVVMVAITVVVTMKEKCSHVTDIPGMCVEDQGSSQPSHLQPVYLGSHYGKGWWRYPSDYGWVRHYQHDTPTITDTERSWAKWIWHNCGQGYVCLESGKFPNYYFYETTSGLQAISYSAAPETEDWTRLKAASNRTTSRGLYMFFISERFYDEGYRKGLRAYIYIPPRCEGYRKVVDHKNDSPVENQYTYVYEHGIVRTDRRSTTVKIEISTNAEIVSGIVSASSSRSFSHTWINEKTVGATESQKHESTVTIPPRKRMVIWQKVATYGPYEWHSAVYFILCIDDI